MIYTLNTFAYDHPVTFEYTIDHADFSVGIEFAEVTDWDIIKINHRPVSKRPVKFETRVEEDQELMEKLCQEMIDNAGDFDPWR